MRADFFRRFREYVSLIREGGEELIIGFFKITHTHEGMREREGIFRVHGFA